MLTLLNWYIYTISTAGGLISFLPIQDNDTALILACQRNELETVSSLLKFGANPTVCNMVSTHNIDLCIQNIVAKTLTSLHLATLSSMHNNILHASYVFELERTFCVCSYIQEGQAPLLLAVRNNNIAIVRELIAARVDVNCVHEVSNLLFTNSI